MKNVEARTISVGELLAEQTYTLGYFQREYNWGRRHVEDLIDDLVSEFQSLDDDLNGETNIEPVYFLGSIIVSGKDKQNLSLIDGQQRITSLLLILIHIMCDYKNIDDYMDLKNAILPLICRESEGKNKYTIDSPSRDIIMDSLCNKQEFNTSGKSKSIKNIKERFQDINNSLFTKKLPSNQILKFVDWLKTRVYIAEIKTLTEQDGYKIFEAANDRGLSLSPTDMLKGYILSNIEAEKEKGRIDTIWKKSIDNILDKKEVESDAIKAWLRARHAGSSEDFIRIGGEFHRWLKDKVKTKSIGLQNSKDFANFIEIDFEFYARWYVKLNEFAKTYDQNQEAIYCNQFSNFTLQYPIMLACITPSDSEKIILKKINVVATFIDILIARNLWNGKSVAQRDIKNKMWEIMKEIRSKGLNEIVFYFLNEIKNLQDLNFNDYPKIKNPRLFLARLSAWLDRECKIHSASLVDYLKKGGTDGYDVEHIIPNKFENYEEAFEDEEEFKQQRNSFSALLLLPLSVNRSLLGKSYEEKRSIYEKHGNLLVKTLRKDCLENYPQLKNIGTNHNITFDHHEKFLKDDIAKRQNVYTRMAQVIWDAERLKRVAED